MSKITPRLIVIIGLAVPFAPCSSPLAKRAARSDGLLDFIVGNSSEVALPIEKVSGGGGRVSSAHVKTCGKNVFVSGVVQRQSLGDPPRWAHVDVVVFDSRQKMVEGVSVHYLPRDIPHVQRGGFPQSRYSARLKALPAAGSAIKVVFHSVPRSECQVGESS